MLKAEDIGVLLMDAINLKHRTRVQHRLSLGHYVPSLKIPAITLAGSKSTQQIRDELMEKCAKLPKIR